MRARNTWLASRFFSPPFATPSSAPLHFQALRTLASIHMNVRVPMVSTYSSPHGIARHFTSAFYDLLCLFNQMDNDLFQTENFKLHCSIVSLSILWRKIYISFRKLVNHAYFAFLYPSFFISRMLKRVKFYLLNSHHRHGVSYVLKWLHLSLSWSTTRLSSLRTICSTVRIMLKASWNLLSWQVCRRINYKQIRRRMISLSFL